MPSKLEKELYRAAVLTFEELGLMLPTAELDESQQRAGAEVTVTVAFDGPFSGRLTVTICGDVTGELAANMLGDVEAPGSEHCDDALGEIGNVICGNTLPRVAGKGALFSIRSPRVTRPGEGGADDGEPPVATAQVGFDNGRADLAFFIDSVAEYEPEERR